MDTGKRAIRRFGKRLQQLRKANRWTQQELAARLEVEQSYVSDVERGVFGPSFARLAKIGEVFGMTIADLCENV
ncbi:MAG: helix-turn-helix domain-containing protein [Candidatus Obscuribacterales bacterium]|nr:helix-turn-helix domain-containing protein [Candidatus Obscuribacterales bacterium]